jgi:hypothetical protein
VVNDEVSSIARSCYYSRGFDRTAENSIGSFSRTERVTQWCYFDGIGGERMKNVQINVEGDKLIIVVDLNQEFGLSSSGKSITVASTEGNVSVPGREDVKIGLNVYKPKPKH